MFEISTFSTEPFCLAHYPSAFHSVMFNPVEPRLLATANSKEGVGLWDIRKPQRYDLAVLVLCCVISFSWEVMTCCFLKKKFKSVNMVVRKDAVQS